jgi:hypothetical protein
MIAAKLLDRVAANQILDAVQDAANRSLHALSAPEAPVSREAVGDQIHQAIDAAHAVLSLSTDSISSRPDLKLYPPTVVAGLPPERLLTADEAYRRAEGSLFLAPRRRGRARGSAGAPPTRGRLSFGHGLTITEYRSPLSHLTRRPRSRRGSARTYKQPMTRRPVDELRRSRWSTTVRGTLSLPCSGPARPEGRVARRVLRRAGARTSGEGAGDAAMSP